MLAEVIATPVAQIHGIFLNALMSLESGTVMHLSHLVCM